MTPFAADGTPSPASGTIRLVRRSIPPEKVMQALLKKFRGMATKKNLSIFAVVSGGAGGASITSARGSADAVRNARKAHEGWEKDRGIDPKHDWERSNIKKAIRKFMVTQGLPKDAPYVLGASAAMNVHGMPRNFDDLDLYVPGLKKKVDTKVDGYKIDASPKFFNKSFARMAMKEKVDKGGISVMSLSSLLKMKEKMNRPKDQKDIKMIRKAIRLS